MQHDVQEAIQTNLFFVAVVRQRSLRLRLFGQTTRFADCRPTPAKPEKLENVCAETTYLDSPFQIRGPETLKVRLPTVDSRNIGTTMRLECPPTVQICYSVEWSKVPWCCVVQNLVRQYLPYVWTRVA